MSAAFCRSCKRGGNSYICTYCGKVMIEAEWPYTQLAPPVHERRRPSFFTAEQIAKDYAEEQRALGKMRPRSTHAN